MGDPIVIDFPTPAIFFVTADPGNAFLRLRAAGNEALALLEELGEGARVEVRLVAAAEPRPEPVSLEGSGYVVVPRSSER